MSGARNAKTITNSWGTSRNTLGEQNLNAFENGSTSSSAPSETCLSYAVRLLVVGAGLCLLMVVFQSEDVEGILDLVNER